MKKSFLLIGLVISLMASAQVLDVKSVQKLQIPEGDVQVAGISPDGSYILLTDNSHSGLQKYQLATGETEVLSTAPGAGYNVQIAADGQSLMFREKTLGTNRTFSSQLISRDLKQKTNRMIAAPTRNLRQLAVAGQLQMERPAVSIENQQIVLTMGGNTTVLSPCGADKSYIWPSVSPDAQHLLFYVCGKGAYISDINGKNVQFLGHDLRAPKWYNNQIIIGMNDKDNGETTISSEIVAVNLQGQKQVLTSGIDAMYPYAANGKIVCSGLNGETYLIEVK